MSGETYLWRVWCINFEHYATVVSDSEPTECPIHSGNPIDQEFTVIIEPRHEEIMTDGYIIIDSSLADQQALIIRASDPAGGIDIDAGSGGISLDTTNGISLNGDAASNFTTSNGNLTLEATAGLVQIHAPNTATGGINIGTITTPVIIIGNTNGTTSVNLQSGSGGISANANAGRLILSSTFAASDAIRLDASSGSSGVTILTGSGGYVLNSGTGGIDIISDNTSADAINIDASGSSGGIVIAAGSSGISIGTSISHPIDIGNFIGGTAVNIHAGTGNVDINSTQYTTISANVGVNIGNTAGTVVNIGNSVGTTGINIDSGTGGIAIGNNSPNGEIHIANTANSKTLIIGNTTGSTKMFLRRGTGGIIQTQPQETTTAGSTTLTADQLLTSIIVADAGPSNLTLPTATDMVNAIPSAINNDSIDFSIINIDATFSATLLPDTGGTLIGSGIVPLSSSGSFRLRIDNAAVPSYIVYRLS